MNAVANAALFGPRVVRGAWYGMGFNVNNEQNYKQVRGSGVANHMGYVLSRPISFTMGCVKRTCQLASLVPTAAAATVVTGVAGTTWGLLRAVTSGIFAPFTGSLEGVRKGLSFAARSWTVVPTGAYRLMNATGWKASVARTAFGLVGFGAIAGAAIVFGPSVLAAASKVVVSRAIGYPMVAGFATRCSSWASNSFAPFSKMIQERAWSLAGTARTFAESRLHTVIEQAMPIYQDYAAKVQASPLAQRAMGALNAGAEWAQHSFNVGLEYAKAHPRGTALAVGGAYLSSAALVNGIPAAHKAWDRHCERRREMLVARQMQEEEARAAKIRSQETHVSLALEAALARKDEVYASQPRPTVHRFKKVAPQTQSEFAQGNVDILQHIRHDGEVSGYLPVIRQELETARDQASELQRRVSQMPREAKQLTRLAADASSECATARVQMLEGLLASCN